MAKNDGNLRQISVQDHGVTVTLGRVTTTVPADQLDAVIRALEAARIMLGVPTAPAPAEAPAAVVAAPTRAPRAPRAAAPEPAPVEKKKGGRPKGTGPIRRSRKRVGDALADWFRDNPGWHSTEELLAVVSDHRMTDASPKRALMIALGKQKDSIFASDGKGHWKLATDPAPILAAQPKEKKKPGRKPGSGKAKPVPAARGKRQGGRSRGRSAKAAAADTEGSPEPTPEVTSGRLVRVKKGQNRKEALLTPQEIEARKQPANTVGALSFRWDYAHRSERERIKRNLFGDATTKSS